MQKAQCCCDRLCSSKQLAGGSHPKGRLWSSHIGKSFNRVTSARASTTDAVSACAKRDAWNGNSQSWWAPNMALTSAGQHQQPRLVERPGLLWALVSAARPTKFEHFHHNLAAKSTGSTAITAICNHDSKTVF
jgi:hypothetical protein